MTDLIRPMLELAIFFPSMLLSYLPMRRHLRFGYGKLAAIGVLVLLLLSVLGGSLCYFLRIGTLWITLPALPLLCVAYCATLKISHWKSVSVFIAVYGIFSCMNSIAGAIDALVSPGNAAPWVCLETVGVYHLLCWAFVALTWYPATHAAGRLLENEVIAPIWRVFWILPILFIALNQFLTPVHPELLYQGRAMQLYIVNSVALLCLLLLFYALFYIMASSFNRNDRLRQENQFLSMQQIQYKTLCASIEETRQARHDMRHHFSVLSSLASRGEWKELEDYLAQVQENIPKTELNLCHNPAVDGVVGHYCMQYRENGIPCSIQLDLPRKLPVSEMDICLVLSNLLENALEASLRTDRSKRYVNLRGYLHSANVVLLTVENAFDGAISEHNGVFQSSKRHGDGIGTQSVRRIAEKNGGYCHFACTGGVFCVNVMLRGQG